MIQILTLKHIYVWNFNMIYNLFINLIAIMIIFKIYLFLVISSIILFYLTTIIK